MIFLNIIAAWFLADALSGVVHYVMDRVLVSDGIFPGICRDNDLHHLYPSDLTKLSIYQNLQTSLASPVIAGGLYYVGAPVVIWLSFVFLTFANVVHRWAHTPRYNCPWLVRVAQYTGLFISYDHHHDHHYWYGHGRFNRDEAHIRFCVMTNYLNPIVDYIRGYR